MSPHRAKPAAETVPGTAIPPSPGFDAAWHPVLGRMLHGQRRRQLLDRRHPWLLDTAVVLVVALLSLPDLLLDHAGDGGPFGETEYRTDLPAAVPFLFAAALVAPLWWRRRAPAVTFFVIAAVSLAQWSLDVWQQAGLSMLVALYSLALHGSLRTLGWAVAAAQAGMTGTIKVAANDTVVTITGAFTGENSGQAGVTVQATQFVYAKQ